MRLHDRTYAAFLLKEELKGIRMSNALIVAVSKGGLPVGYQLARLLHLPMEVLACSKIYHPLRKDLPIGAICDNEVVLAPQFQNVAMQLKGEIERLKVEMAEFRQTLNGAAFSSQTSRKTLLLVDDGASTGNTLQACLQAIRRHNPYRVIVVVPVLPDDVKQRLVHQADGFVSLVSPPSTQFISQYYDHFPRVTDQYVQRMLEKLADRIEVV